MLGRTSIIVLGVLVLGFATSGVARSATLSVSPQLGSDPDFGSIEVGQTLTQTFEIFWDATGAGEGLTSSLIELVGDAEFEFAGGGTTFVRSPLMDQDSFTVDVIFAPLAVASFTVDLRVFLEGAFNIGGEGGPSDTEPTLERRLLLTGEGIEASQPSVVPLPAALPLFGTGLALVGFVARRRTRAT